MATPDPRGSTWQLGKGAASFNHKWALSHACWTDQPFLKGEWKFGVYKMNGWMDLYGGDRKNAGGGY
jgi:hypothetical protein